MKHLNCSALGSAVCLILLVLAGCIAPVAPAQSAVQPAVLNVKALDYRYEMPAQIEAGLVTVVMENAGQEPHHAQLVRLNDDVTVEQFQAALQSGNQQAVTRVITLPGGPAAVDPGMSQAVTLNLTPGQYFLLCFVPSHDGVPHIAKGMIAPLTVIAPKAGQPVATAPVADQTIKFVDFSYVLPTDIKAGKQVWQVVNEGTQPHEVTLIKLAEGKTMEDVMRFMMQPAGAPPFANVGGFQAIDPGKRAYLHLNLTPGNYVALCHIPDPASGKPHEQLGMVLPFTVKSS